MEKVWKHFAEFSPSRRSAAHQNKNKKHFRILKMNWKLDKYHQRLRKEVFETLENNAGSDHNHLKAKKSSPTTKDWPKAAVDFTVV